MQPRPLKAGPANSSYTGPAYVPQRGCPQPPPSPLGVKHSTPLACNRPLKCSPGYSQPKSHRERCPQAPSPPLGVKHPSPLACNFSQREDLKKTSQKNTPLPPFSSKTYGSPIGANNTLYLTSPLREKRKRFFSEQG